jgi:hypothetical protein
MTGADDPAPLFAEIDRDGDGMITREEWLEWRQQGFAGAADRDRMAVEDCELWDLTGRAVNRPALPPRARDRASPQPART